MKLNIHTTVIRKIKTVKKVTSVKMLFFNGIKLCKKIFTIQRKMFKK